MVPMAKASLISNRSTSSLLQPVLANSLVSAPTGARVNSPGSWLWVAWPTIRASGCRPRRLASSAVISTRALAPSEIELELAAVMVPSLLNAGLRLGILSGMAFSGCSSSWTTTSPLRVVTVMGTISATSEPFWMAVWARRSDSMA
ncbi:hypothetical protein D3C86_1552920 [compost metagenome]